MVALHEWLLLFSNSRVILVIWKESVLGRDLNVILLKTRLKIKFIRNLEKICLPSPVALNV